MDNNALIRNVTQCVIGTDSPDRAWCIENQLMVADHTTLMGELPAVVVDDELLVRLMNNLLSD